MAALDLTRLQLDFFRAALEGEPVPGPPVRVFVLGVDRWSDEQSWPPEDVVAAEYGLVDDGSIVAGPGHGTCGYRYDPAEATPTHGGRTFLPGLLTSANAGMKDQSQLLERADGVWFSSAPLDRPLLVIGDVSLSLSVATEGTDIDLVATLLDIHPDGRAINLCEGARRASSTGVAVEPNVPVTIHLDLAGIAVQFGSGHRIGIRIASASVPRLERGENGTGGPARITLLLDDARLTLPVRAS
jgi:putative CocE/NonD family hydrolase